jgi:hypothetical protein
MWACLASVSNNKPLEGFDALVVVLALAFLGMTVFATLLALLTYGHIGREKAIANIENYDRKQLIVDRAHKVARMRRRDEKSRIKAARSSESVRS